MYLPPLAGHLQAFREIISLLTQHKDLTWEMAKRELTEKYSGQALGFIWIILHPLILIGVYIFIFVAVFKVKIGGTLEMPLDYTTYLLSGLIPWLGLQEVMSKSTTAIVANATLVKQVIFPIEILPVKGVIATMLTQGILLIILITYVFSTHFSLPLTYLLLPLLIFLQLLGSIGISYILAAVGVYFRDIKDIIQVVTAIGPYILPIFYLPEQVPKLFQPLIYLNPFSYLVWCYQDTLYFGRFEHYWAWIVLIFLSHLVFTVGYRFFRKLKFMFGNVL